MENIQANGPSHAVQQPKLYGITRADLPAGLRAAQVGHALIHWALAFGQPPENLVLLEVPDLKTLNVKLAEVRMLVNGQNIRTTAFYEPDCNDELTAFAVGPEAAKVLSNLPLLLRAA